ALAESVILGKIPMSIVAGMYQWMKERDHGMVEPLVAHAKLEFFLHSQIYFAPDVQKSRAGIHNLVEPSLATKWQRRRARYNMAGDCSLAFLGVDPATDWQVM